MENKACLIFSLHGLRYGVDALLVQEIFHLPELAPVAEAPDYIIGLLNLHSKIVPVIDLALRLGYQPLECCLSDSVIVLNWEGHQIGIIVNQVHEVMNISSEVIEREISYGRVRENSSRFIDGIAKVGINIIMLLSQEKLLYYTDSEKGLLTGEATHTFFSSSKATPEERVIFQERAENLRWSSESRDSNGLMPLAVVGFNGEYFGLDLEIVREFTNIRNVTPIPCCPAHVIGSMNLRGEIVTLVDIRTPLNMPSAITSNASKAIVIHIDDLVAGFPVDEVFDVVYIRSSDIMPVPAALNSSAEYFRGTAPYFEKTLSILDLPKIMLNDHWVVNQEV